MALIPITISAVLEEAVGWYETIVAYCSLMKLLWALRKKGQDLLLTARRVKGLVKKTAKDTGKKVVKNVITGKEERKSLA